MTFYENMWTILWSIIFHILQVQCNIFFPTGSIQLRIPFSATKLHPFPIANLSVLPFKHKTFSSSLTYTFKGSNYLQAYNTSSALHFTETFFSDVNSSSNLKDISGWLEVQDAFGEYNRTHVQVKLEPGEVNCEMMTTDLCFWEEVMYVVPENYPPTVVGELSSKYLKELCSEYNITYTLLNGTSNVSIMNHFLHTIHPLDRDIDRRSPGPHGSVLSVAVRCAVSGPAGTTRDMTKTLRLYLVDENDNPLKPQIKDIVLVKASNEQELKAELSSKNLIFVDRDSTEVNNYTMSLLNDDLQLFTFNFTHWTDDRNGEHQTVVHFKLWPKPSARIPVEGYEVVLLVNDTGMVPGSEDSTANLTIRFLPVNFTKGLDAAKAENQRRNTIFPSTTRIFRTAAMLARVAQPPKNINVSQCRFQLSQHHDAFNVTVRGGIVYVNNVIGLRKLSSEILLEIRWFNKTSRENNSDLMTVSLEPESKPSCTNLNNSIGDWGHCASQVTAKSCQKTCGLGTGGYPSIEGYTREGNNRCMWRGEKKPGTTSTRFYSTCTSDSTTCPDTICDELEELHHWLCPQDCTEKVSYTITKNKKTNRGIFKGIGICKCDKAETCSCINRAPASLTTTPSSTTTIFDTTIESDEASLFPPISSNIINISRHTGSTVPVKASSSPFPTNCGSTCVISIAGGALFLLVIGTTMTACWRRRRAQEAARRDRKLAAQLASAPHSNYTGNNATTPDNAGSGQLLLNFDMGQTLYVTPKIIPVVDTKWEFPRENLRIEQTLGEGEFGRVLRAKALEIAGLSGFTTVAVKTLKEDARDTELADLMSEYQLLKEVSHPNVIRLLGACTLPGGPVYLIIEFAEHGSLRNYLRRSRHLESEGQTPNSTALMLGESEPVTFPSCKITPRDILSFAWQISKGMNYLNDMKLVHRDLAARNVLLAGDMVCKISDFGLTRDVYEDDTYLKRTKGRVPVKWMAPESLADHMYNSKSDVWSFGILLWELVTLGASPYPGVAVQNLFHLLRSGYRMEKPENCSILLYKIMRMCWCEDPNERPSFRSLMIKFESMLADGMDYLDLNPRVVHNRTYFTSLSDALITPDEVDETAGYGNLTLMQPDTVNLLYQPQNKTKFAEVDKLQVLWKRPESPKSTNNRTYENEEKTQELHHYESPVKCRNKAEGLRTPTNDRPQSYIDMAGAASEVRTLLRSKSKNEMESISKVTSL